MRPSLIRQSGPALAAGLLFGAGLTIAGMTDPRRVRGFLDLFGRWDPTLVFVMIGAVAVMALAWRLRRGLKHPIFGGEFALPDRQSIDARLLIGSALFGIGWGLAGLCPGPALASLAIAPWAVLPFLAAMIAGMAAYEFLATRLSPQLQGA